MSYIEFTGEKIYALIQDKVLENLYLDYKSVKSFRKKDDKNKIEISRDISAFANSDGGDIIYGIAEKNHIPTEIDGKNTIIEEKTWLEQVINSNIQPRITGIRVYPVHIEDEKAVLIVHIPKSHTAHQAKDQKYWCRFGSEKQVMEDYQVRQTMNRMRDPVLTFNLEELEVDLTKLTPPNQNTIHLDMYLVNNGVISAKSWRFNFHFPRQILFMHQGSWQKDDKSSRRIIRTEKWKINETDAQQIVLHPGQRYALSNEAETNRFVLSIQREYLDLNETLHGYYEIYAENMPPKYGVIDYIFNKGTLTIQTHSTNELPFIN